MIKQQFNHGDVFQATGKVYADFVEFLKIHTGLVLLTVIGSAFAPASFWLMEMLMPNQPVSAAVTVLIIAVQIFLVTPLYLLVFRFAGLGNRPPLPFPGYFSPETWKFFLWLLGLIAPVVLLQLLSDTAQSDPTSSAEFLGFVLIQNLALFAWILVSLALLMHLPAVALAPHSASLRDTFSLIRDHFWTIVGVLFFACLLPFQVFALIFDSQVATEVRQTPLLGVAVDTVSITLFTLGYILAAFALSRLHHLGQKQDGPWST